MAQDELELSERDSIEFVKVLLNDTEPNEALREAAKSYRENIGGNDENQ